MRMPASEGQALEADDLAEILVQKGHTVTVRTALGGGGGCECLRNLRHVFLSVRIQVKGAGPASIKASMFVCRWYAGGMFSVHDRSLKIELCPLLKYPICPQHE